MSSAESNFLKGLMIQYREVIFKDPIYQDNTLGSILMKNVQRAVQEGIISKHTALQMLESLNALKRHSIKELAPKEQQSVLQGFQRAIADQSDMASGYEDFKIKIVEMKLHFGSVKSGSRQQSLQHKKKKRLQVEVEAKIQTRHQALTALDSAVAEARTRLGIQPVAEGVVQGHFVCVMDPRSEQFEIQDLKADYFLKI